MMMLLPQSDVLGETVTARNNAIIAVVIGTVLLAALCAVLIGVALRPLNHMARRMRVSAKLEQVDADSPDATLPIVAGTSAVPGFRENASNVFDSWLMRSTI